MWLVIKIQRVLYPLNFFALQCCAGVPCVLEDVLEGVLEEGVEGVVEGVLEEGVEDVVEDVVPVKSGDGLSVENRMRVLAQFGEKGKFPKKGLKCARTLIIPLLIYCFEVFYGTVFEKNVHSKLTLKVVLGRSVVELQEFVSINRLVKTLRI